MKCQTLNSKSDNLSFEVLFLFFANFSRLTAVKIQPGSAGQPPAQNLRMSVLLCTHKFRVIFTRTRRVVSKNVTRQEGLTRGGSVFHVNGYRRLTEKDSLLR